MTINQQEKYILLNEWLASYGPNFRIEPSETYWTLFYGSYTHDIADCEVKEMRRYLTGYISCVQKHRLNVSFSDFEPQTQLAGFLRNPTDALNWRTLDTRQGEVRGLHTLRGKLIATNGILAVLETWQGRRYEVHLENFVEDPRGEVGLPTDTAEKKPRSRRVQELNTTNAEELADKWLKEFNL
jgi:hypothetical protein